MSGKKQSKARRNAGGRSIEAREKAQLARKHETYRRQWMNTVLGISGAAMLGFAGYGIADAKNIRGGDPHTAIVAETDHYQINAAMLSYYYQEHVDSYLDYQSANAGVPSFDPEQPLDEQYYDSEQTQTWYAFFMDTVMNTVNTTLKGCEAAYAAGYTLPEETLAQIEADSAATDLTHYQNGLTQAEVADVMTMQVLARGYAQEAYSEISVSDAEIEAEAQANAHDYEMFSMEMFAFEWELGDADGEQAARAHAEALAACKTRAEFEQYVRDYLKQDGSLSEETIERRLLAMRMCTGYGSYSEDVQTWIQTAQPSDTYIFAQAYYVEVLMLLDEPALDDSECADLRVIYLPASSYDDSMEQTMETAQSIIDACKDAGGSAGTFAQLARQYSADSTTASNGGLVEGYSRIRTTYGAETSDWAFDAARETGDMFICERDSAAMVIFYEGKNDRCGWENQVYQALLQKKNDAVAEALSGSEVRINEKNEAMIEG